MTRRRFVILAHWATACLLAVLLIEGPPAAGPLVWGFSGAVGLWTSSYVIARGPLGKPGPKLDGWLRPLHSFQHHALYVALAILAYFVMTDLESMATGRALKVVLFLGLLHGVFHLWRHTALFDGALRKIFPSALHRFL